MKAPKRRQQRMTPFSPSTQTSCVAAPGTTPKERPAGLLFSLDFAAFSMCASSSASSSLMRASPSLRRGPSDNKSLEPLDDERLRGSKGGGIVGLESSSLNAEGKLS